MTAFRHGVASADPLPDGVLLWTRCTTDGRGPVPVDWWVSPTAEASDVVARGTAEASPEADFTVDVDVRGLEPATSYWYGFRAGGTSSPVGRTRTAPDGPVERLRVGLVSCAYWSCGFFNAYANLAARDVDLVVHVGDYLYENDVMSRSRHAVRAQQPPGPLLTLADYRTRHAQYKTDADLQALHARHPIVAVWDDHELVGGTWRGGAGSHRPSHGDWRERTAGAVRAYFEWVPVRRRVPHSVYRTVRLGPLADLVMLDTRLTGRDRPATSGAPAVRILDPGRSLLGEEQWAWLEDEVRASRARWVLVGNQVMQAPLRALNVAGGLGLNPGQWDGYPAERERFYDTFRAAGRSSNVAVMTGDIHSSWAADLPVGAEFITPSVTTDSFARTVLPAVPGASALARRIFLSQNRHLRLADLDRHGYVVLDVTPERLQADWWHVDTITRRDPGERWGGGWWLADGQRGLRRADAPAPFSRAPTSGPSPR